MTHTPDDFDEDFQDAQATPPPAKKPGMAGNLRAAWQGSPLFKLFVLVVGVGALTAAIIGLLSGGNHGEKAGVTVGSVPGVTSVPGSKAPPAYVEAVNDASKKRAEEAVKEGTSALPTPVSGDVTTAGLGPEEKESQYDPLAEFRPNIPPENTITQAPNQEPVELIDSDLLAKMQQQMTALFDSWRAPGIHLVQVIEPSSLKNLDTTPHAASVQGKILIPAGTINYAQLLVEANSDVPGPILAEVMSGPFTGARAIGQFEVTRNYLILHFTKLTYHRHDYAIDALAIDPNTTLGGLVTEKDNRYLTRVILPAAAGFLEGFGSALGATDTTVNTTGSVLVVQQGRQGVAQGVYRGLSEAAQTAGSFFRDEAAATKPLIRVASGTPMGLFFVNSMTESNNGPIETPVNPVPSQTAGPPLPPPAIASERTLLNQAGISGPSGLSTLPQSSLANSGITVIQNTPK